MAKYVFVSQLNRQAADTAAGGTEEGVMVMEVVVVAVDIDDEDTTGADTG